jgi:hypothetical protein
LQMEKVRLLRKYILLALGLIIVSNLLSLDNDYGAHQNSQCKRYQLYKEREVMLEMYAACS